MKISLSRLLTLFLVGISALPVIAMAVLILMMNSDIRSIAEAEFDRMDERNARRLAADTLEMCAIIQGARDSAAENARRILFSELARFGHARLLDSFAEAEISAEGVAGESRTAKIPELAFGDEKLSLVLDGEKRIVGSAGGIAKIIDSLKSDTGLEFSILLRINDAGDMLRVASTVEGPSGGRYVGDYIPAAGAEGSRIVRAKESCRLATLLL